MTVVARAAVVAAVLVTVAFADGVSAPPAQAKGRLTAVCDGLGVVNRAASKACSLLKNGRRVIAAGGQLARAHLGSAVKALATAGAVPDVTALGLAAVAAWAARGAKFALDETAKVVASTVRPRLAAPWFSTVYWRVAGIAALLTLPFLFAAAIQALLRSDLSLLARAAFGYLPLAMLAVGVAAQLTALLLTATDGLSGLVSSAAGDAAPGFLTKAGGVIASVSLAARSPFLVFLLAVFTVAGAIALWTEMMMRDAAVYVIVVMLPLAFAAMVWPARRVWALRAVELLVALILAKLAIVTVLALGGAALESVTVGGFMVGPVLLALAIFAPWGMLRLVPMAELASGAAGRLRAEVGGAGAAGSLAYGVAQLADAWASATTAQMRREADGGEAASAPLPALEPGTGDAPGGGEPGGNRSRQPPPDGGGPALDGGAVDGAEASIGTDDDAGPDSDSIGTTRDGSPDWGSIGTASGGNPDSISSGASARSGRYGAIGGEENPGLLDRSAAEPPDERDMSLEEILDSLPPDDGNPDNYTWTLPLGPNEPPPERPWPGAERLDRGSGEEPPPPPSEEPPPPHGQDPPPDPGDDDT